MKVRDEIQNYLRQLYSIFDECHVYLSDKMYVPTEMFEMFGSFEITAQPTEILKYPNIIETFKKHRTFFSIDFIKPDVNLEAEIYAANVLQSHGLVCQNIHIDEHWELKDLDVEQFIEINRIPVLTNAPNETVPVEWQILDDGIPDICHSLDFVNGDLWINKYRDGGVILHCDENIVTRALYHAHKYFKDLSRTGRIEGWRWMNYIEIYTNGTLLLDYGIPDNLRKWLTNSPNWKNYHNQGFTNSNNTILPIIKIRGFSNVFDSKDSY